MNNTTYKLFSILLLAFLFWGCPSTPPKAETETRRPELSIQIANLNLHSFNKKIEKRYLTELAKVLKREQIEVLTVQSIVRYPGLSTRIDFVDELTRQTDWRNAFGEMVSASGRQTGNAIFSSYPILSHHNQRFDKVKSSDFEAAIEATIDGGVRSMVLISAQLPPKASSEDQARCIKTIADLNPDSKEPLTIVAGNLPSSESVRTSNSFVEVPNPETAKGTTSKVWYSANPSFQLMNVRSVETELGTILIAQLGLFRQQK
jgi:hypothetical protein